MYRAALAGRLGELGFAIERQTGKGGHYFELSGIPVELREVWSSRHQEIEDAAAQWRQDLLVPMNSAAHFDNCASKTALVTSSGFSLTQMRG